MTLSPTDKVTTRWVHSIDLLPLVAETVRPLEHSYPVPAPVTISIRRARREDGCWCYRYGKGLDARPHHHHPNLGCPIEPAGDDYVLVTLSQTD